MAHWAFRVFALQRSSVEVLLDTLAVEDVLAASSDSVLGLNESADGSPRTRGTDRVVAKSADDLFGMLLNVRARLGAQDEIRVT